MEDKKKMIVLPVLSVRAFVSILKQFRYVTGFFTAGVLRQLGLASCVVLRGVFVGHSIITFEIVPGNYILELVRVRGGTCPFFQQIQHFIGRLFGFLYHLGPARNL